MELWIMAAPYNVAAHRFVNRLSKTSELSCRTFPTVANLMERLRRPVSGAPLLILFPADRHELEKMLAARHLMRDLRIILVLEEVSPESISAGHRLRPRYIAYADSDLSDLIAVTIRMVSLPLGNFQGSEDRASA